MHTTGLVFYKHFLKWTQDSVHGLDERQDVRIRSLCLHNSWWFVHWQIYYNKDKFKIGAESGMSLIFLRTSMNLLFPSSTSWPQSWSYTPEGFQSVGGTLCRDARGCSRYNPQMTDF